MQELRAELQQKDQRIKSLTAKGAMYQKKWSEEAQLVAQLRKSNWSLTLDCNQASVWLKAVCEKLDPNKYPAQEALEFAEILKKNVEQLGKD